MRVRLSREKPANPNLFVSVAGTLDFSQPFLSNPHVQRYRRQQLWPQSPRNLYHLRQLYQDAETRCTLRLWRLSRRGELDCEKDEDCTKEYGSDVYCRELQVCKLTKGNVCWLKQPDGIECSGDSACLSGHCDSDLGICTPPSVPRLGRGYHTRRHGIHDRCCWLRRRRSVLHVTELGGRWQK
ncbi:hypothetical protein FJT64_007053 [Amphibalanus amphitrite]|uniref:Uncharacterized protein n=1 Tax=Amphibalanus amphitrite TaxID=1232801 RepID=A0A6A4VGC5_AMPAM|nr:hypothetical protein FJT64_007053 [Amphibalanus amphitrite]